MDRLDRLAQALEDLLSYQKIRDSYQDLASMPAEMPAPYDGTLALKPERITPRFIDRPVRGICEKTALRLAVAFALVSATHQAFTRLVPEALQETAQAQMCRSGAEYLPPQLLKWVCPALS